MAEYVIHSAFTNNKTLNGTLGPLIIGRYDYTTTEMFLHRTVQGIIGLLTIFSAFTNIIVIYVFSNKNFGKRTIIKYLYANISLSDEVFVLSCLMQVVIYGESSCTFNCRRFIGLVIMMSGFISAYTMALIAFKRYYGIAFPLKELVQGRKKLPFVIAIVLIWLFSISAVLFFMKYEQIEELNETFLFEQCTLLTYSLVALRQYPYFPLIGLVIVPLVIGLFFSLNTIYILQRRQIVGDSVDSAKLKENRQNKLKSTFMIAVVIISFVICWLPVTVVKLVDNLNYSTMEFCDYNYNLYCITTMLLMLSLFINPVIYWYMSPHFRRGINHIFLKRKAVNQNNATPPTSS